MNPVQAALKQLWEALDTDIERVLDENDVNVANAQVRPVGCGCYLYVDDVHGYDLMSQIHYGHMMGGTRA